MRGTFAPISPRYSEDLKQLILSMLHLDPNQRPTLTQVMSQPIVVHALINLQTDIGRVRCNSRSIFQNKHNQYIDRSTFFTYKDSSLSFAFCFLAFCAVRRISTRWSVVRRGSCSGKINRRSTGRFFVGRTNFDAANASDSGGRVRHGGRVRTNAEIGADRGRAGDRVARTYSSRYTRNRKFKNIS